MPRIYVEFSGLDQIGSRCKTVASRVDTIFNALFGNLTGIFVLSPT